MGIIKKINSIYEVVKDIQFGLNNEIDYWKSSKEEYEGKYIKKCVDYDELNEEYQELKKSVEKPKKAVRKGVKKSEEKVSK